MLTILQPVLIPNLADLTLIVEAEKIYYSDCDRWSRKSRVHRAKIKTADGTAYIHIPILEEDRKKSIHQVRIDHHVDWKTPLLRTLEFNYRKSLYYDFYEPEVTALFESAIEYDLLIGFIRHLNRQLFTYLELTVTDQIFYGSEIAPDLTHPDKICTLLGETGYRQDSSSSRYHHVGKDAPPFHFTHPVYRQHFEGFEANCSVLDLLFQYGPESFRIIDQLIQP